MVEIDDEQRERPRLALRLGKPARELIHEVQAVRQRGQRIVVRLEVELLVLRGRGKRHADAIAEVSRAPALLVGQDRRGRESEDDGAHDIVLPDDRQHEQRRRAELRDRRQIGRHRLRPVEPQPVGIGEQHVGILARERAPLELEAALAGDWSLV